MKSEYDKIASKYDERYAASDFGGIENLLSKFYSAKSALEIGCGTGKWLSEFEGMKVGLDKSLEMLKEAKAKNISMSVQAAGEKLPLKEDVFEFVFIVNAIHFIRDKHSLAEEIFRVLKTGGKFILVFADVYEPQYSWYLYDFFPKAKEIDYSRFERTYKLKSIFAECGFTNINVTVAEKVSKIFYGKEVLSDPFLKKHNSSQLTLLTKKEYETGLENINKEIAQNPAYPFKTEIIFKAITAGKI